MAYIPGFEHDIFISYAHLDDIPLEEEQEGWVTKLQVSLMALIPQKIGRAEGFSIWRDLKLKGNDEFADTLDSAFRRSALMLTILTPSYLASMWCSKELEGFSSQPHPIFGPKIGDKNRVFKVMPSPDVPADEQPTSLKGSLSYQFYKINQIKMSEERFRRTTQQDSDQRYWSRLDDLARDIANLLKKMRRMATGEEPALVTVASTGPVVYLAEVTDDLIDQRDEVRRTLEQQNVTVLPKVELQHSSPASVIAAREALVRAQLSVHLLGYYYGRKPVGEDHSFIHLQYIEALKESTRRPLAILSWLRKDFDFASADERQKEFLTSLEDNPSAGGELLKTGIEELKDTIMAKVAPPSSLPLDEDSFFYISCTPDDSERARRILSCLRSENCQGIVSLAEGADEDALRKHHRANLRRCDVFMILYGCAPELWVQDRAIEAWEVAKRRKKKPMKMYVHDWPPPLKKEVGIALQNLERWESSEEFTCEEVRKLLRTMNRDTKRPTP
jgi:hypothetical protein